MGRLWRVSDCEELVGLVTGDVGVDLVQQYNIRVHRLCVRSLQARVKLIIGVHIIVYRH